MCSLSAYLHTASIKAMAELFTSKNEKSLLSDNLNLSSEFNIFCAKFSKDEAIFELIFLIKLSKFFILLSISNSFSKSFVFLTFDIVYNISIKVFSIF